MSDYNEDYKRFVAEERQRRKSEALGDTQYKPEGGTPEDTQYKPEDRRSEDMKEEKESGKENLPEPRKISSFKSRLGDPGGTGS